jgi:hypothetical protein
MPVVLYGFENLTVTLREECRMREFERWMIKIYGSKRDGATGRKLHNMELHYFYSSPNIIKVIRTRRI